MNTDDLRTCKPLYGDALMLFSNKKNIYKLSLKTKHKSKIGKDTKQAIGVCYDGLHYYWTEVSQQSESIVRVDEKGKKEVSGCTIWHWFLKVKRLLKFKKVILPEQTSNILSNITNK